MRWREIKEEGREGYFKIGRNSIGTGDISEGKKGMLLLAKELSMMCLLDNNKLRGNKKEIKDNNKSNRPSLLKSNWAIFMCNRE